MRLLIEGPDGAGKSTICAGLTNAIPGLLVVNDPNHLLGHMRGSEHYTSLRDIFLHPFLAGNSGVTGTRPTPYLATITGRALNEPMNPKASQLLILAGEIMTADHVDEQLRRGLFNACVHDRWVLSTLVYQAITAKNLSSHERTQTINRIVTSYLDTLNTYQFDLTIMLQVNEEDEDRVFDRLNADEPDVFEPVNRDAAKKSFKERCAAYRSLLFRIEGEVPAASAYRFISKFGGIGGIRDLNAADPVADNLERILTFVRSVCPKVLKT